MKRVFSIFCLCLMLFISGIFCFSGCDYQKEIKRVSKNLSEYEIEMSLQEEDMTLSFNEKVNVRNNTDVSLSSLCFNFYPRAFREDSVVKPWTAKNEGKVFPNGVNYGDGQIESVLVSGKQVSFSFVGENLNAFGFNLESELNPQESVLVEIKGSVKLPLCTHRLGYYNGSVNLGNFFPILAVYEKGDFVTQPYYSTGDPFYSENANYQIDFSFPSKYTLQSTGEKISENINGQTKNVKARALAVRDFAMSLTEKAVSASETVDKTVVTYQGYEGDENLKENLQTAVKALKFYNKTFGKYPYKTLTVVKAPFVHGGMEYPNLVYISDSIVGKYDIAKVIAHEIAHQWWYQLVGNNQISEAWLDESLAEYSSVLFFEAHNEYEATYEELVSDAFSVYTLYADIVKSTAGKINTSMLLKVNEYSSEFEYSYMIYTKGILMFDCLRQTIGKNKLLECFKKYFSSYKFKTSSTDCLIASFRKTSRRDVEGFFDSWLQGKTVIGSI